MSRFRLLLFGFILPALSAHSLFAQVAPAKGSSALFTLNARTVVEDVVVMDKSGHAVPGLRKRDFQVFENGKPQAITFFEPHFAATEAAAPPAALPPDTYTNIAAAPPNNVTNVLLLDALDTGSTGRMYAQAEMVKYLASLPPHQRIGVFALTDQKIHLIWGFDQDSSALRATVDEVKHPAKGNKNLQLGESANALRNLLKNGSGILLKNGLLDQNDQLLTTLNSLQALARYLAGIPGRKNLFWLVGDFPLCPLDTCPYVDIYRETKDMLAEAGVSVYPIDAGGADPRIGERLEGFEGPPAIPVRFINSETWAEETGGKAYHENDIAQEIANGVDHGSRYYTLAYVPRDRKEEGRERTVEVKVLSGKYTIFYRKRYFEQTQKEIAKASAAPAKDPLLPLMGRGMPNIGEIPYSLKVVPSATQPEAGTPLAGQNAQLAGKLTRYTVGFQLQASGLSLVPDADGARRKPLGVALMVFSQDGKPLNWVRCDINLLVKPEQWATASTEGIPFHLEIDAPQGDVYLRTGVYDPSTGKVGTLEVPLSAVTLAQR